MTDTELNTALSDLDHVPSRERPKLAASIVEALRERGGRFDWDGNRDAASIDDAAAPELGRKPGRS